MTAITLNLLAEELRADQARARDPFKAALAIGVGLISLTALCGAVLNVFAGRTQTQVNSLQARWDECQKNLAKPNSGFAAVKARADQILAVSRSRILYARQLALVKDVVPDAITCSRLGFAVRTELLTPTAPAESESTAADGGTGAKPERKRAAAATNTRYLVLQMEGKATSSRPELEVDKFIQALQATPAFNDQVSKIQLRSIARNAGVSTDEAKGNLPSVQFVIECQFKERS